MNALSPDHGVCAIEIEIPNTDQVIRGTGFHYGSGWVMSNAHVFQHEGQHTKNLIKNAKFTFYVGGNQRVFGPLQQPDQYRTAFIHKLAFGGNANLAGDVDIAMIKLGKQYEYGRTNFLDWETTETDQLLDLPILSSLVEATIEIGSHVQAMYPVEGPIITVIDCTIVDVIHGELLAEEHLLVLLKLSHNELGLPPGSSGCPIVVESNNVPLLVGLHFAGGATTSWALYLKSGIAEYFLNKGVEIIAEIGSYLSFGEIGATTQSDAAMENLSEIAIQNDINIYLPNGQTK